MATLERQDYKDATAAAAAGDAAGGQSADLDGTVEEAHTLSRDALLERWAISPENVRTRSLMLVALLGFALAYGGGALLILSEGGEGGPDTAHGVLGVLLILIGIGIVLSRFVGRNSASAKL